MADGGAEFHVELDDPAGNSYLQVSEDFCVGFASLDSNSLWLGTKVAFFWSRGLGGAWGWG